jgi:hypothetical protein
MATGLAVIVTGDGAAMDFCDPSCAYLVESVRRSIAPRDFGLPPSRAGYWLAEPDRASLGRLMAEAVARPEARVAMGRRGRERVLEQLDWDRLTATAASRLTALAAATPRRLDPDRAFRPGLPAFPLDGPRATTVLVDAAPGADGRRPAGHLATLVATAGALAGTSETTLVVHVEPEGLDAVAEVLADVDLDILVVAPALADAERARLYGTVDAVVAGADVAVARRAERCGTAALTDLRPGPLRAALVGARSHRAA